MNHERQQQAERLVKAQCDEKTLQATFDAANDALNSCKREQRALRDELSKAVGANVDTAVFQVGDQVVVVKHQCGVAVYQIETKC